MEQPYSAKNAKRAAELIAKLDPKEQTELDSRMARYFSNPNLKRAGETEEDTQQNVFGMEEGFELKIGTRVIGVMQISSMPLERFWYKDSLGIYQPGTAQGGFYIKQHFFPIILGPH